MGKGAAIVLHELGNRSRSRTQRTTRRNDQTSQSHGATERARSVQALTRLRTSGCDHHALVAETEGATVPVSRKLHIFLPSPGLQVNTCYRANWSQTIRIGILKRFSSECCNNCISNKAARTVLSEIANEESTKLVFAKNTNVSSPPNTCYCVENL